MLISFGEILCKSSHEIGKEIGACGRARSENGATQVAPFLYKSFTILRKNVKMHNV